MPDREGGTAGCGVSPAQRRGVGSGGSPGGRKGERESEEAKPGIRRFVWFSLLTRHEGQMKNEVIENMSHGPVTTNPLIIMCINMSIVFAVLIGLSIMIKIIHMIDPTKEKKEEPAAAPAPKAAPAAAPAAPAAPAVDPNLNIAVIAAAVAAYGGDAKIVAIRPIESVGWKNVGRANGVQNTVF